MTTLRDDLHRLLVGGGIYGASNAMLAATQVSFAFGAAWLLPPTEYGSLSLFIVFSAVSTMIVGLGLSAAAQREFFRLSPDSFTVLLAGVVRVILFSGATATLLVLVAPSAIVKLASLSRAWLVLGIGLAVAQAISQLYMVVLQTRQQLFSYAAFVVSQVLGYFAIALALLIFRASSWTWFATGQSAVIGGTGLAAAILLRRDADLRAQIDPALIKGALKYSAPLVPHQVGTWMLTMLDRFIIAASVGTAAVGVYSLAFQVAQLVNLVSLSTNQAFVPLVYQQLAQRDSLRSTIRLNLILVGVLAVVATATVAGFRMLAPRILSPAYADTPQFVGWLAAMFFFVGVARLASNVLMFRGRTMDLAVIAGATGLGGALMNALLVPRYGVVAAGWTACAAAALLLLLTVRRAWTLEAAGVVK